MAANLKIAFEIMGKGMLGIFTAIIIIMLVVMVMQKLNNSTKKKEDK